jgi:EAL domain-containing protein (putative c-di-GMP-specific phosphodiesterase class I)
VIVRSIIEMAHNLGMTVTAEGVETRAIWEHLVELGCDAAQGYYMSRPLAASDVTRWIAESPWGAIALKTD